MNPYFTHPTTCEWRTASPWGTTFNAKLMSWLADLKWPISASPDQTVLWIELMVSFRLETGMAIPVADPKNMNCHLTPGIHVIHCMPSRTLGAEVWTFKNALDTLSKTLMQPLFPWDAACIRCSTKHFGLSFKAGGLNIRPIFPKAHLVHETLYRYLSVQRGKPTTSLVLDLPTIKPIPEPEELYPSHSVTEVRGSRVVGFWGPLFPVCAWCSPCSFPFARTFDPQADAIDIDVNVKQEGQWRSLIAGVIAPG